MDILRCLETFCTIVESGSFTVAAEKRYLTQPSVSTHIRDLEKHYGVKLLNRRRDGITATDTGKLLYKYAKSLLRLSKEAQDAIDDVNRLVRGETTIGASTVPGTYLIPELLSRFKKEFPGIRLSMKVSDTSMIIDEVFEQNVDFGIVGEKRNKPGLIFTRLADDNIILVVHPGIKKGKISVKDLGTLPLIFREHTSGTRMAVMENLKKRGITEKDLNIIMELGSTEALKQGVLAGLGAGFVSERSIKHEESQGLVKRLPIHGLTIHRNFWIVKRATTGLSRAAQALYNFIRSSALRD
jgi:DNA-binding transcriptional LysR family regulator